MYGLFAASTNYPNYGKTHTSIVSQVLTCELYEELYALRTRNGYTLDKAIQLSVDLPTTEIGFTIGDEDTFSVYQKLIEKILCKCQKYYKIQANNRFIHKSNLNPCIKYNEPKTIRNFILDMKFYLKRNLKGYSLPSHCTRAERYEIDTILVYLFKMLQYDIKKQTFKFESKQLTPNKEKEEKRTIIDWKKHYSDDSLLLDNNFSENEFAIINLAEIDEGTLSELELLSLAPSRMLSLTEEYLICGFSRDFPSARSLFYNIAAGIGCWTNHENHLEFVILDEDANLAVIYKKFTSLLNALKNGMKQNELLFMRSKEFGYIVNNLKQCGTGLVIDIHAKCQYLSKHKKFDYILSKHNLKCIERKGFVCHLQTVNSLGRSEHQMVESLAESLILLLRMEKRSSKNKSIDNLFS